VISIIEKPCVNETLINGTGTNSSNFTMIAFLSLNIAFISKPEIAQIFPGFFSKLSETRVLKFCPELETLLVALIV